MQSAQDVKQQCIFCQIVAKAVPSKMVYEDAACIAVLDINPATPGHLLVLPKEHYAVVPQMPDDVVGQIAKVIKALSRTLIAALGAEGTSVYVANGPAAGQRAQHVMIHVIPRRQGDGLSLAVARNEVSESDFSDTRGRLSASIEKMLGFKPVSELPGAHKGDVKAGHKEGLDGLKSNSPTPPPADRKPVQKSASSVVDGIPSLDELSDFLNKGGK